MIRLIHVFGARQPHAFQIGEKHPIEKEAVVPIDDEPDTVAQRKRRPEVVGAREPHQA